MTSRIACICLKKKKTSLLCYSWKRHVGHMFMNNNFLSVSFAILKKNLSNRFEEFCNGKNKRKKKRNCCILKKTFEISSYFHLSYPSFELNLKYDIPYEIVQASRNVTNRRRFRNISSKESSSTSSFFFLLLLPSLRPRLTFDTKNKHNCKKYPFDQISYKQSSCFVLF